VKHNKLKTPKFFKT